MSTSARAAVPATSTLRIRSTTQGNAQAARARRVPEILRQGTTVHGTAMVLRALPSDMARSQAAVVASRKIGNAVTRNRAKRRLREAMRLVGPPQDLDLVLIARTAALSAPMDALIHEVGELATRAAARLSEDARA